jgi:ATP-dependent 26S proteasome regulatory subunit
VINEASAGSFRRTVAYLCRARFPLLFVQTWEEHRLLDELAEIAADAELIKTPRQLYEWSLTEGLALRGGAALSGTSDPIKALDVVAKSEEAALFVFKDFHIYLGGPGRPPDHRVVRRVRDLVGALRTSPQPKNVVFVSPAVELPLELQKDVTLVEFRAPGEEEIRRVLRELIDANRHSGRVRVDLSNDDEERLVKAALGLTLHEAENAFARAMVDDGALTGDDVETVLQEKSQVIKKTGLLEFISSEASFDEVGGLQNLKRWLQKRSGAWLDAAGAYGLSAPKGILITGVPGCGKSLTAKCTADLWQLPLLRLDIGRVFSGLVGSSEQNMRVALQTAEAIAPSVLWIDEIEKGFSSASGAAGGGDSGTSQRVFGTFLTWMQEKESAVFVIATANSIDALPPEFLRKGRFDEIFFVDLPTRSERIPIWRVHLGRRLASASVNGDIELTNALLDRLADRTEGYSGAEIEQAALVAVFDAYAEGRSLRVSDVERAIDNMVPLSTTFAEQITRIRAWANVRAVAATAVEDRVGYAETPGDGADVVTERGGRTIDI